MPRRAARARRGVLRRQVMLAMALGRIRADQADLMRSMTAPFETPDSAKASSGSSRTRIQPGPASRRLDIALRSILPPAQNLLQRGSLLILRMDLQVG
jgi:hypothetical protein